MEIVVDGETFEVREREPGTYEYTWASGPNPAYGFTRRFGHAEAEEVRAGFDALHEDAVREFLAAVDRETGFID